MKAKLMFAALLSSMLAASELAYGGGSWPSVTVIHLVPCSSEDTAICSTNGMVQVEFSANGTGGPSCGSGFKGWAAINITTSSGQALYAAILMARVAGLTITATGTGTCDVDTAMETLGYINE